MPDPTTSTTVTTVAQGAVNFTRIYNHTGVPVGVVIFIIVSVLVVLAAGIALGMILRRPRLLEAGAGE